VERTGKSWTLSSGADGVGMRVPPVTIGPRSADLNGCITSRVTPTGILEMQAQPIGGY
jgi:hypothetical protein